MNNKTCDFEAEVQKAALSEGFSERLRKHVGHCLLCREIVSASDFMQEIAKSTERPVELPNARYVWWKAQVLRIQLAEKRATRLFVNIRRFAYLAVVIGLAGLFIWQRSEIRRELSAFTGTVGSLPSSNVVSGLRFLVYLIPVFLAINIALTFRTFWVNRSMKK